MKQIDFYYDPVSPFAYLAFVAMPQALEGLSYQVRYCPAFLGGILKHWGQLAPAEVPPKREWTLRQLFWIARERGIALEMPTAHPFNSLALLRMAMLVGQEAGQRFTTNRYQTQMLFEYVWQGSQDPLDAMRLAQLAQQIGLEQPLNEAQNELAKQRLRIQTQAAIEQGIFGMPAFVVEGALYWGFDSLPMLRTHIEGKEVLPPEIWNMAQTIPSAVAPR